MSADATTAGTPAETGRHGPGSGGRRPQARDSRPGWRRPRAAG